MEPVEILVLCILLFIIFVLVIYLVAIKRQIATFSRKVSRLLDPEYEEIIKVDMFDRDIVDLANNLNKHVFRQRKIASDYLEDKKKLDTLVTGISHDFRTPLTASIGYLQMIQKSDELKSKKNQEYLKIALDKNIYLKQLSDDFFDISKMGRSVNRDINIEKIRLSCVLEERLLEQFEWINKRQIVPEINIDKDVFIEADVHDIDRIIYNLFSNCQKYAVSTISVSLNKEELVITNGIADECEIEPENVFEPFYRGASRNKEGSGLGLYVVKCIASEYGYKTSAELNDKKFTIRIEFHPGDTK